MPGTRELLRRVGYAVPGVRDALEARHRRLTHDVWRRPVQSEGNTPADYATYTNRSELLEELLADTPKDSRILEVGCNVGRNLAHLADVGYSRLEGVEINPHAVALLRQTYPQLADVPIHVGPAEDVLPGLEPFDLVFTMAVLMHLHPSSDSVLDEIARLGSRVLVIEPSGQMQFQRDLRKEFTSRGMTLVEERDLHGHPKAAGDDLDAYEALRFERR